MEPIIKARCTDCDSELEISADVVQGEIISCPGCGLELEVKKKNGEIVELEELVIEGEDWGE